MDKVARNRVQLCGRFVVEQNGSVREPAGRQLRMLLGYLVLNRHHDVSRDELAEAVWPAERPPAVDSALSSLLSKARHLTCWPVDGRSELRLRTPVDLQVDTEFAVDNVHAGEAALLRGDPVAAYAGSVAARYITARTFLSGCDAPWVVERRAELDELRVRALECFVEAALQVGGVELVAASRAARELVDLAPFRETGHALRLRALSATGNRAEALLAYDVIRCRLRDELGVDPGPELRAVHQQLLADTTGG